MNAETVAASAAVAAAVVGVINIEATRRLTRSMESTKWTRQLLPGLVRELDQAHFDQYMAYFDADWFTVTDEEASDIGMQEFRRASDARDRLEVFAAPATILAAREVSHELTAMRFYFLKQRKEGKPTRGLEPAHEDGGKWHHYWRYAEANHAFLNAARSEMGLKPVPVPPGLEDMRRKTTGSKSRSILHQRRSRGTR